MILFRIEDIFNITGRGIVLTGKIEGGEIELGDLIELNVNGSQKIRAITSIQYFVNKNELYALQIRTPNEAEIHEIRAWEHQNYLAKIIKKQDNDFPKNQ